MPSPIPPCQENPWLCSMWPSWKTSLTTFRLAAAAAADLWNCLSHFTTRWRMVKHLGFTSLFLPLHLTNGWLRVKENTENFKLSVLWEHPLQNPQSNKSPRAPKPQNPLLSLSVYFEDKVVLTTWNICHWNSMLTFSFAPAAVKIVARHSCLDCS